MNWQRTKNKNHRRPRALPWLILNILGVRLIHINSILQLCTALEVPDLDEHLADVLVAFFQSCLFFYHADLIRVFSTGFDTFKDIVIARPDPGDDPSDSIISIFSQSIPLSQP